MSTVATSATFLAKRRPEPELYEQISRLDPVNPFLTPAHARAEETTGGEPWVLGYREGERISAACLGFLRRGRLNRELSITSVPEMPPQFWAGLKEFSSDEGITLLALNTFCSRVRDIPTMGRQVQRRSRYEYVLALEGAAEDLLRRMKPHHQRLVRKGMKAGLVVRMGEACRAEDHVRLIGASMQRRVSRGERIHSATTVEAFLPSVSSGLCRLFQACRGEEVLSSIAMALAPTGRYLQSSGTSPEGMKIGASHYLLYEIMRASLAEGATLLNLGGVSDPDSGLAEYKRNFGCDCWESQSAEFYVGSGLRHMAWRMRNSLQARRKAD